VRGIGTSLSNVVAGWLTNIGGYGLAYWVHGGVAAFAAAAFFAGYKSIAPTQKNDIGEADDLAVATP
ncbi:MFS transporter, partial [Rhizobium rhizogenes]